LIYSLLVGSEPDGSATQDFETSGGRFLEYTSKELTAQFSSLSREARATLMSWPCLCMAEGRGEEPVILGQLVGIDATGADTIATVRKIAVQPELTNDTIWRLRNELDIGQFEFSRHHWAIKERDLTTILADSGIVIPPEELATLTRLPLPAPDRNTLLAAKNQIGDWGHTEITDLLLEAGIDGLVTPPTISRRDRANAILAYIFANPSSTTAEGSLFSAFFVRKAGLEGQAPAPEPLAPEAVRATLPAAQRASNRVFVVHGRNEAARKEVADFLGLHGLQGIVLNEQANMGRHLLTKFIQEAALTTFAVVLLTDDDIGGITGETQSPRARQNVILELGYFISFLGQERVCALKTPGLETPSDFDGIGYIAMEANGKWKEELLRELVAAKLPIRKQ
jgi:predicted nucleotide-binding protein